MKPLSILPPFSPPTPATPVRASRLCPGCGEPRPGDPYCEGCRRAAAYYDYLELAVRAVERKAQAVAPGWESHLGPALVYGGIFLAAVGFWADIAMHLYWMLR